MIATKRHASVTNWLELKIKANPLPASLSLNVFQARAA
jgi:hypothetical protein